MTERANSDEDAGAGPVLLSDSPTVELVLKAKSGDASAANALLERCLPGLKRWAHGRLPREARRYMDTNDLVQEVALNAILRLSTFEPRRVGAMQAYLRQSVINRIRDEVRRVSRRGTVVELSDEAPANGWSPLELAIQLETYDKYREALLTLRERDRELALARIELEWSDEEIAQRFQFRTRDGARMAATRAVERLGAQLHLTIEGASAAAEPA